MPLTPEQRKVLAPLLEVYGLDRDPASFAAWIQSNELATALAHLVATDGNASFLLRCLASGVLRVALESTAGLALVLSAAGRAGVTVHDAITDTRTVTVDADGHAGAYLMSRDGAAGSVLTAAYQTARGPNGTYELAHAGGGIETIDFGSATCCTLAISCVAGPVACYRSASAGNTDSPMGICSQYTPLWAATEQRYLDLSTTAAGLIHVLRFPIDQLS